MRRPFAIALSVTVGILAVCAQPGRANGASRAVLVIEADAALSPALLNHIRETFDGREDIDHPASVKVSQRDGAIVVEVLLPDGRSAVRSVPRQDDVIPTLEALLLVPQRSTAAQAATPEPATPEPVMERAPAALDQGPAVPDRAISSRSSPAPKPGHLRIELSVAAGARAGDGQTGVGLGASSDIELFGWLVGLDGRIDRYRNGSVSEGALRFALLGGRRFRFDDLALDLVAGPGAELQGTEVVEAHSSGTGTVITRSSPGAVPRLVLGSRLSFGARSTLHTFVGVDGEVGPVDRASRPALAVNARELPVKDDRLPAWTVGFALGATVGAP
jgi:hypothetical protein